MISSLTDPPIFTPGGLFFGILQLCWDVAGLAPAPKPDVVPHLFTGPLQGFHLLPPPFNDCVSKSSPVERLMYTTPLKGERTRATGIEPAPVTFVQVLTYYLMAIAFCTHALQFKLPYLLALMLSTTPPPK